MNNELSERLLKELEELEAIMGDKTNKFLDLNLLQRVVKRLDSFSPECEECSQGLSELEEYIAQLKEKQGQYEMKELKQNKSKVDSLVEHLQNKHKLVIEGQYLSMYMSLGMCIGLVFGLTIFDNIALGIPIGMGVGLAIGSGIDADAKKKGMVL